MPVFSRSSNDIFGTFYKQMSFQSFSKLPSPTRHRPKNLPTLDFIALLNLLCEDTINDYDDRNHVLTIFSLDAFEEALRQKANRSLNSFEKQLRMLGFKKQRQSQEGEDDQIGTKYYWRGRKEEYLIKEMGHGEKSLSSIITKMSEFREQLLLRKENLDHELESSLFWGLTKGIQDQIYQKKTKTAVQMARETINWAHRTSGQGVKDVQMNLEEEISLLRLLAFRHSEINDDVVD